MCASTATAAGLKLLDRVYLGDEDTSDALRVVTLWIGWPKELLAFPFLKAVQEGWVQDVLQHLDNEQKIIYKLNLFIYIKKQTPSVLSNEVFIFSAIILTHTSNGL